MKGNHFPTQKKKKKSELEMIHSERLEFCLFFITLPQIVKDAVYTEKLDSKYKTGFFYETC